MHSTPLLGGALFQISIISLLSLSLSNTHILTSETTISTAPEENPPVTSEQVASLSLQFSSPFSFIHSLTRIMGVYCHCFNNHKHLYLIISLLFLSSTQVRFLAEGRRSVDLLDGVKREGVEEAIVVRPIIGSRPPSCERRCSSCGHCEAVQVPAGPQKKNSVQHFSTSMASRGDYSSNYKPVNWKCKCGDFIFNP